MQQVAMFPLTDEERLAKADELAEKIGIVEQLEAQKDATAGQFSESIKKAKFEVRRLAKEIRERQAEREASDDEAPWQGLLDRAQEVAGTARRRRDRTGEMADGEG
jgi:hypothetical protein